MDHCKRDTEDLNILVFGNDGLIALLCFNWVVFLEITSSVHVLGGGDVLRVGKTNVYLT